METTRFLRFLKILGWGRLKPHFALSKCFQTALAFYPCIFSWTGNKRFTSTIHCLQRAGVACACHANPPFKVTTHTPTFKSPWQYVYRTYQTPTFTPARVNFVFEGVVEIMRRRYLGEVVWKSGFRRFCYFYDVLYLTRLAIYSRKAPYITLVQWLIGKSHPISL